MNRRWKRALAWVVSYLRVEATVVAWLGLIEGVEGMTAGVLLVNYVVIMVGAVLFTSGVLLRRNLKRFAWPKRKDLF